MSFDLSQLDRVAKGQELKAEEPSPKSKLRLRPHVLRRKGKEARHSALNGALFCQQEAKPQFSSQEPSEGNSYGDVPLLQEAPSVPSSSNQDWGQGHALLPMCQPAPEPVSSLEAPDGKEKESSRKRKSPKEVRNNEEMGGRTDLVVRRKSNKHARLERLAQLTDLASLPLCDLISRATFLEDQKLQEEAQVRQTKTRIDHPHSSTSSFVPNSMHVGTILAPQVTVVDGKLVVNQESLELRNPRQDSRKEEYVRVEEGEDRIVNYHSYADWASTKASKWSAEESELLIQGIGQFGIDFSLLERLFPGRGRKQIKAKFSRMWKEDPEIFGKHFNKKEGETEESYDRFVQDLRAERITFQQDDNEEAETPDLTPEKPKAHTKGTKDEEKNLSYWSDQEIHY